MGVPVPVPFLGDVLVVVASVAVVIVVCTGIVVIEVAVVVCTDIEALEVAVVALIVVGAVVEIVVEVHCDYIN